MGINNKYQTKEEKRIRDRLYVVKSRISKLKLEERVLLDKLDDLGRPYGKNREILDNVKNGKNK